MGHNQSVDLNKPGLVVSAAAAMAGFESLTNEVVDLVIITETRFNFPSI